MFRPTPSQRPLFGVEHRMDADKRARLEKSWAHAFRTHALPLIDEEQFRRFFADDNGRPNKSVRLVVSALLLKELSDLTDRETLEQIEWNAAWHYALDVVPEDAHTCQKTLHNFRAMLLADDQGARLFEDTTARLILAAKLKTGRQRHDSTHTIPNIKILTRLGLFTATITQFLETLRAQHSGLCRRVDAALLERYLDREGYFSDARGSEAPRRLEQAALDVYALVRQFADHSTVAAMPSYRLLERLYHDQCEPPDSDSPVAIKLQDRPLSSSLQSPSDPDVTYGHKGKGYEVQLTETCEPDNAFQAITAVGVNHSNQSDQQALMPTLEQVERTCGAAPQVLFADAGYGSGDNLVAAAQHGTDLQAPIAAAGSDQHFPIHYFHTDADQRAITQCPNGQAPIAQRPSKNGLMVIASFSAALCASCPVAGICPTERRKDVRVLSFSRAQLATSRRQCDQETAQFKEQYKIRSGIEATNSELKRGHSLRKLRVRRFDRVTLVARLKALALNFKRYLQHLVESLPVAAAPSEAGV
jgi:hypothetical protein